jgi:PTS system mannose-specific IIC component/fructoselysine and glucoselysine-specific PTS system IIC component
MLLAIMMDKELIPFFIIGYTLAAFTGRAYNMIGIGAIGLALAWIYFLIADKLGGGKAVAAADDGWED